MRRASLPPGDGSAVLVDCRPGSAADRGVLRSSMRRRGPALVGWEYRLLGAGGCAGDRKPTVVGRLPVSPARSAWTVDALRRVFATPTPAMAGAEAAGDPIAVLPVLFISCGVTSSRAACRGRCIRPRSWRRRRVSGDADEGGGASPRRLGLAPGAGELLGDAGASSPMRHGMVNATRSGHPRGR